MNNKSRILIITAHPDDESLWFSSVALRNETDLICVTCGNDKESRAKRKKELNQAVHLLGINKVTILDYDDIFKKRLDIKKLEKDLQPYTKLKYSEVFTHGPFGDTNEHFHHQDISYVVNKIFTNVYCTAWNQYPDVVNQLTPSEYSLKKYIMGTIYRDEYKRLKTTYEASSIEKFVKLSFASIEILYLSFNGNTNNNQQLESKYLDLRGYRNSPYEIERISAIATLIKSVNPKKVLEIGAEEGVLSEKIARFTKIECVEEKPICKDILTDKGFKTVKINSETDYDLVVVLDIDMFARRLSTILKNMTFRYLVTGVTEKSQIKKVSDRLKDTFSLIKQIEINPRWEKLYHDNCKEKLEIYKHTFYILFYGK